MPFKTTTFDERLKLLSQRRHTPLFCSILRGIEREGLRVNPDGGIARTAHPAKLGSPLTHANITTDYSEALMEFITEPSTSIDEVLQQLRYLLAFSARQMNDEVLWAGSMPCQLGADADIPIARYGESNVGQMKEIYRVGLGNRYGRNMQTIAGIHFNYSLPDSIWNVLRRHDHSHLPLQDYKTEGYFGLIRNFRRWLWLLLYLTGASPAVCRSFVKGREHHLSPLGGDEHTLHAPLGTSLRMGDLGYQSSAQEKLTVCYNGLDRYVEILRTAILTDHDAYKKAGVRDSTGEHRQLNAGLLQIENEFYSTVRPKQTARRGETQLKALADRGVEYVEVRCLDLDPFDPLGLSAQQIHFIEAFLLTCVMSPSPMTFNQEYAAIGANQRAAVYAGRDPELKLLRGDGSSVGMRDWAREIFDSIIRSADVLDDAYGTNAYTEATNYYARYLDNPDLTPSARVLKELEEQQLTYFGWTRKQSEKFQSEMLQVQLPQEKISEFAEQAQQSLRDQAKLEAADEYDFATYLSRYFEQYRQL